MPRFRAMVLPLWRAWRVARAAVRPARALALALAVLAGWALGVRSGVTADDATPPGRLGIQDVQRMTPPPTSDAAIADAALNDVCFVNRECGWAVGDRGAIWHTEDGGRSWQLQTSGVACRLQSVCFVNPRIGWAAGGYVKPFSESSVGIILATQDGGQRWTPLGKTGLPSVQRIKFFNERQGIGIGHCSTSYPTGVFLTESAGQRWNPVFGEAPPGWTCGDFPGPRIGALAGQRGSAALLVRGELQPTALRNVGLRVPARMKLVGPQGGWLVGQGGLLLRSGDLGATWDLPPTQPESLPPNCFDLMAVDARGPKCWVAGSPGTRVFVSGDAGETWRSFSTGNTVPLRAICFVDDQSGWAVGQFGTILATQDGGQTWRRQRAGGQRAALLGLFGTSEDVPLEWFARLSGNEGYLGIVELLHRSDVDAPEANGIAESDRASEAMSEVGACGAATAWQFPVHARQLLLPADRVLARWDRLHDGRAAELLQARLVRAIRLWRPDIVVTQSPGRSGDPLSHRWSEDVLRAVAQAADRTAFADQISEGGLATWEVRRVYGTLGSGGQGEANVAATQLAERLGRTLGEIAAPARAVLLRHYLPAPENIGFEILHDRTPRDGRHDFLTGIALMPGKDARRALRDPPPEMLQRIRIAAQRRRGTQAVVELSGRRQRNSAGLLAQSGDLLRNMTPQDAGMLLFQMAQDFHRQGNGDSAADACRTLVDRYPEHPMAENALRWLVHHYVSREAAWQSGGGSGPTDVRQTSTDAASLPLEQDRVGWAGTWLDRLRRMSPAIHAEPEIGFSRASVERHRNQIKQADLFYSAQRSVSTRDAWWECAAGEMWLADRRGRCVKPTFACQRVDAKPHLDGRLDDPMWRQCRSVSLRTVAGDDGPWPATVQLAHDGRFLYLGIRATQAEGARYDASESRRSRDADLSRRDRIELCLDIDRDYATYFRLVVDHRGWTAEDCWGDATWDPRWFVAAASEDDVWCVEAAIPLDQLTRSPPTTGTAWAIGIQRIIPGVGFQSWNTPASPDILPEGFGYLLFE